MNIWLINPYGSIPGEKWREYRFSIFANELSEKGHNVIWWTSAFSHHFKKHRSKKLIDLDINPNYKIRLIPTPGYNNNISLKRIFRDLYFSFKVYRIGHKEAIGPDLIIFSEIPLFFGNSCQKLAKKFNIPLIYDQMDLHPELMINIFHKSVRPIIKFLFYPLYLSRKKVYKNIDGIVALSKYYLQVPLNTCKGLLNKPNEVIYNGINVKQFRFAPFIKVNETKKNEGEIWIIFAGTLGPSYDILNIIDVSKRYIGSYVKFFIAGDGPLKLTVLKNKDSIIYLGKLQPDELINVYRSCDIALSAYGEFSNVEMPDKFYDYTAAGLPIINSLKGEVANWISIKNIGINYIAGDRKDLYSKIEILLDDKNMRIQMKNNSYELGNFFDQKNQVNKLEPLINEVIKSYNYKR